VRKALVFAAVFAIAGLVDAKNVWIDTDVSIGSPVREVDDAYALVLAFHSPELRIAGISTSYGNAPLADTTRIAREMVRRFGPNDLHVFAGAASPKDLDRSTEASNALRSLLAKDSVTYIALGPLTNLATFIELHPEMTQRIERVIFVGGQVEGTTLAFGPKGTFRIHDANVFKDPIAAGRVLDSKIPLVLVPISADRNVLVNDNDLHRLQKQGGAAEYLARRSKLWLWFWRRVVKEEGGPIFDALAVMGAARPELVGLKKGAARMDQIGNLIVSAGLTTQGRRVLVSMHVAPNLNEIVLERVMKQ
jgi:inosine-uridine nucleoside N-ribohydrolase